MRKTHSDSDFTAASLPATRQQQFRFICKTRLSFFASLGGVSLLFALPFILAFSFNNIGLIPYAEANYSGDELSAFLRTNEVVFSAVYSVGFLIYAVGLSGMAQLIKKLSWGQGIFFWHDFGTGIKKNVLRYLLTTFLFCLLYVLSTFLSGFFSSNWILGNLPFVFFLLLMPFLMSVLVSSLYYSGDFFSHLGNGFAFFARRPLQTLAFLLLPLSLLFLDFIPYPLISVGVLVVLFFAVIPFYAVGFVLFELSGFDRFTNRTQFLDYYHKGLRDEFDLDRKKASIEQDAKKR